jgi:aminoglycoside phosphotransferase (APT) family kinase protein
MIDEAALATATGRWLDTTVGVEGLRRLSGGASRETWSFDAVEANGARHELVLRRDPSTTVLGSARATEFEVLRAAGAAGVAVPEVAFLLEAADGLGTGFVMVRVDGETIPRRILRDDEYAAAREQLTDQLATQAALVHAVPIDSLPELPVLGAREQLEQYRGILDGIGEPHPAFELGLRRLDHDAPDPVEPALVHGDFRNGNLVVGPDGLRSLLDWELSHLGDPVEDLGWCCVRSWRFGNVDRPVGGFGSVNALLDTYVAAGGSPVDPARLAWWEAFGTLKWGLICAIQAHTHLGGLVRSVELATLGRRITETEWDLLVLLVPDAIASAAPLPEPVADATPRSLQDRPSAAELLEAVREFVDQDVQPTLEGREAFHARVAANALGIVERELVVGPSIDAPVVARLSALLRRDGTGRALVAALAAGIRDASLDDADPEVVATVLDLVRAKLAVANPRYAEARDPAP